MGLTHADIDDFVNTTLPLITKNKWEDISLPLQKYTFASRWFREREKPEEGGQYLTWTIQFADQTNARPSKIFDTETTNRVRMTVPGRVDWTKQVNNYSYDVDEDNFQMGEVRLIRYLDMLEKSLYTGFFVFMENMLWTAPGSSTLDPMVPSGIPFWVQRMTAAQIAAATAPGWNGANPPGWAAGAGSVDSATYTRWKNWNGLYAQISRDDLVEKIITACDKCDFRAPRDFAQIGKGNPDWGYYTTYPVLATMRRMLATQNDSLGLDVAAYSTGVLLRSSPIEDVPALTESESLAYDATDPFYGINWNHFGFFFKSGRNMLKEPPAVAPNQPSVRIRRMTNWCNSKCTNRRTQFVLHKAA